MYKFAPPPKRKNYINESYTTVRDLSSWNNMDCSGCRDETPMINHLRIHRFIDTINCRATHFLARQPLVGQGLTRLHAHTQTPHSVGLFWTSDQPDAEDSTLKHKTQQTSMPQQGFEPAHPRLSAANGIGVGLRIVRIIDTKCHKVVETVIKYFFSITKTQRDE